MESTRRDLLKSTAAALAAGSRPAWGGRISMTPRRPNFVFVLTDDQRWDSLSATGHPFARTPHIDRLVKEGARFSNAFVTTSLCSPSRASFLTGQYAHTHAVRDNSCEIRAGAWTFPRVLRENGYKTGYFGKWHMGADNDEPRPGFDRWVSFKGQGPYQDPEFNIDGVRRRSAGYTTDLLTDHAVEWIREQKQGPFCAYVAHKAVHTPIIPAPRHKDLYAGASYPRPKSFDDPDPAKPRWVKARRKSATGIEGGLKGYGSLDEFVRRTCQTLASVDEGMGKILSALEETGTLDDTIVIFAGDNGFFHGEHGLLNKRAMYEESIRIPFLVRYPKLIRPGTVVDQMVLNIDLAPSILELAGLIPPKGMAIQGRSWKPLLERRRVPWRSSWLYEYYFEPPFAPTPSMQGIRTNRWKYVRYPDIDDNEELYDLKEDPAEMHNLAMDPRARKQLADMRTELSRLLKATGGSA